MESAIHEADFPILRSESYRSEYAEFYSHLRYYPQPVRDEFDFLLGAAQFGMRLKEDHGYWIDYKTS